MKKLLHSFFRYFNIQITKITNYKNLIDRLNASEYDLVVTNRENIEYQEAFEFIDKLLMNDLSLIVDVLPKSKSQLRQDLFVLNQLNFKKGGYFVEFGATNGIDLSNTYVLEKNFGWQGILAEPSIGWHNDLIKNRKCNIDKNCVWTKSNELLDFNEVFNQELSTISFFNESDWHSEKRKNATSYKVNSISLIDLLKKYNAPKEIDYLSIDTEGSEYEILRNFDFEEYSFKFITVEHNYTPMREEIFELLTSKGYIRKLQAFSKWDDWYVK